MKKLALLIGAGILFSTSALAQVIDPQWKAAEQRMKQEQKKSCNHIKNIFRAEKCDSNIYYKYERNGDIPGTREYIKKRYSHMSNVQMNDFIHKYQKDYVNKCRSVAPDEDPLPGEVTCDMVSRTTTELNFMLDVKGGGPNPFDQIFGKGTSFGSEHTW